MKLRDSEFLTLITNKGSSLSVQKYFYSKKISRKMNDHENNCPHDMIQTLNETILGSFLKEPFKIFSTFKYL